MKRPSLLILTTMLTPLLYGLLYYGFYLQGLENPWLPLIFFLIGLYLGIGILFADLHWLYQYYVVDDRVPKQLITRSLIFMVTLVPLALFMLTSTGSALGMAVLLGLFTGLVAEMLWLRSTPERFQQVFLFQLQRPLTSKEIDLLVAVVTLLLVIFALLVIV